MKKFVFLMLSVVALSGCSVYQSDGKEFLQTKGITTYRDNLGPFKVCYKSIQDPDFLKNDNLDKFSIKGDLVGFLDQKQLKFWSYTFKNQNHIFCESQLKSISTDFSPFVILNNFEKFIAETFNEDR